jgi:hypothetical protein
LLLTKGYAFSLSLRTYWDIFTLPLVLDATPARARTWYAILEMAGDDRPPEVAASDRIGHGIRYNFSAQAFTDIRMDARLSRNNLQPGASITTSVTPTEYGIPVAHRANVRAERELPDNTRATLALSEADSGRF